MKRFVVIAILIGIVGSGAVAQSSGDLPRRNTLSLGLGGGGLVGATYERNVWSSESISVNAHAGVGYLIFGFGFPHGVSVTLGGTHSIELGAVGTWFIVKRLSLGIFGPADDDIVTGYRLSPLIGYRRQRPGGGLVVRLYFSPFMHNDSTLVDNDNNAEFTFVPWGGLMFGFAF